MRAVLIILSFTLTSCVVYPTIPAHTPEQLASLGETQPFTNFSVSETRHMVRGLRIVLEEAAVKKNGADTVLREISFYGTLVLVGGTLEKSIAARNIGAGSAGLATVFSDHYGLKLQKAAFTRAARQARCLEDAIRPIAPEVRSLFDDSFDGNAELANNYYAIPSVTFDAVNRIRVNLAAELDGVVLGTPSVTELTGIYNEWSSAAESAKNQAKSATVKPADVARAMTLLGKDSHGRLKDNCVASAGGPIAHDSMLCATQELLSSPTLTQKDRKKHFIIAVGTYAQTVAACFVTKQ